MSRRAARPFYGRFAWAYDRLSDRPIVEECGSPRSTPPTIFWQWLVGDRTPPVSPSSSAIASLPLRPPHDAVLCRGVLNDVLEDRRRRDVFLAFARTLARGGALMHVREWHATVRRKSREPVLEKTVETPRGMLAYRSETRLERRSRWLRVAERHQLTAGAETISADYDFVMRCWTRDELDELLASAGFVEVEYRGSYDRAVPAGATDRLVVVATRA